MACCAKRARDAVPVGQPTAAAGYVGGQREPQEGVAGQEAFRSEVAVRAEVRERLAVLLVAQQLELGLGLRATAFSAIPGVLGKGEVVRADVLGLTLGLGLAVEDAPPFIGGVEPSWGRLYDSFEPFAVSPGGLIQRCDQGSGLSITGRGAGTSGSRNEYDQRVTMVRATSHRRRTLVESASR